MAKTTDLKRDERIKAQTKKYIAMVILGGIALAIFVWFALIARDTVSGESFAAIGAISILVFAVCAIFAKKFYTEQDAVGSSLKGEKLASAVLEQELGEDFSILSNVPIQIGGKTLYIDLLAVGPTGIFPMVTKNDGTKIEAVGFKNTWKIMYMGVTGNDVPKKIPNPLMEADALADGVRVFMKSKNAPFSAAVYPLVIFTVPKTQIHLDSIKTNTPMCVLGTDTIRLRNHFLNRKQQMDGDAVRNTLALFTQI